jgi:uroporphyrinogen-III synthase
MLSTLKIKKILISQFKPTDYQKSPFHEIARKHNIEFDFHKFIKIEGLGASEFRKYRIPFNQHDSVILTSRLAVDHFFRMAKLMRYEVPDDTKYFCLSESTALYLQKYIQYRKRKIFISNQDFSELVALMKKHNGDRFLFACSDVHKPAYPRLLEENGIDFSKAVMYRTVYSDLKQVDILKYDMIIFFSPVGVESLFHNFPDFEQNGAHIACFGAATEKAIKDKGLKLSFSAPTRKSPSMTMALEEFLSKQKQTSKV